MPTFDTGEGSLIRSVSIVDRSADAAPFGGVARIDFDDRHAKHSRLVFDMGAELGEGPGMQARSLRLAGLNPDADVREFFNRNRAPGAFSLGNEHLRNAVVGVFAEAGLLARECFQSSFGGFSAAPLKSGLAPSQFAADALDACASIAVAVAVEREIDDTEIDAEHTFDADLFRVRYVTDAGEIPLTLDEHQIDFAFAISEQGALALAADERDFLPAAKRPDAHGIGGQETNDTVIVGLGGMTTKAALAVFAGFVGIGRLGDAAHSRLRRQPEALANVRVSKLMQIELPRLAGLEGARGQIITSLVATLKRLPQQLLLLWRWLQLDVGNQFHYSSMETAERFVKPSARHFLRHLKEAVSMPQDV